MKNVFLSLIATLAISSFAAAQNFVTMTLPKSMQSTDRNFEVITKEITRTDKGGATVKGYVRLSIPESGTGLVKAEFTQNLLDEKLLTSNFYVSYERQILGVIDPVGLSECLQNCQDEYTNPDGSKRKGRGACKFNCWMVATAKVVEAIVTTVVLDGI